MGNSAARNTPKSSHKNMKSNYIRRAHHAGSWYHDNPQQLDDMLSKFLADASENKRCLESYETESMTDSEHGASDKRAGIPRACICPHAGFQYSGPTAAYSYLALKEALLTNLSLRTIVVLHPSHHVHLDGCAVSGALELRTFEEGYQKTLPLDFCVNLVVILYLLFIYTSGTPLRTLSVDLVLREQLLSTGKFTTMDQHDDEHEHSGEMQYPFIAKILNDLEKNLVGMSALTINVLPVMIGSIKCAKEKSLGELFAPFLSDNSTFTVISSDFCHWGNRFNYTPQPSLDESETINEISEFIEYLDRKGMDLISLQRPGAFADYLRESSNTICGRHPIAVWLNSVSINKENEKEFVDISFVKYAQSGKALTTKDYSVSYASAIARLRSP